MERYGPRITSEGKARHGSSPSFSPTPRPPLTKKIMQRKQRHALNWFRWAALNWFGFLVRVARFSLAQRLIYALSLSFLKGQKTILPSSCHKAKDISGWNHNAGYECETQSASLLQVLILPFLSKDFRRLFPCPILTLTRGGRARLGKAPKGLPVRQNENYKLASRILVQNSNHYPTLPFRLQGLCSIILCSPSFP